MSVLKQKLDKAAEEFQTHQFKEALSSYEDCIAFCNRTRQAQSLIFNIMTTKASLHHILGEVDRAMSTLNQVLRVDPNHYLALVRRSQVYKKKQKFNRALKDLELVSTFCPDNLQVTAMKIEIETMRSKNKDYNSSSEESESEDEYNEEMELNFSNLKKIDRKSCSIVGDPLSSKTRKSRVTISGDTAVEYESEEVYQKSNNSTSVSKEQAKQMYLKTFKQIEMDKDEPAPTTNIVSKPAARSKSILKNKIGASIIIPQSQPIAQEQKYGGRQSRFVEKIKDIDGKVITSQKSIGSDKGPKQVQFRKSMFASQEKSFQPIAILKPEIVKKNTGGRKSCLKRSSFQQEEEEVKQKPVRKSKFEMLSRNSIDGVVIKNRKSIDMVKEVDKNKVKNNEDSDEESSSHNIFGSKDNVAISTELKQKLGISQGAKEAKPNKGRSGGGKSILKKNSDLLVPSQKKEKPVQEKSSEQKNKKAKKSVMFTKSRFAE